MKYWLKYGILKLNINSMQSQNLQNPTPEDLLRIVHQYFSGYVITSSSQNDDLLDSSALITNEINVVKLTLSVFFGLEGEKEGKRFGETMYKEQIDDIFDKNYQERKFLTEKIMIARANRLPTNAEYYKRLINNYKTTMQQTEEFASSLAKEI